MGDNGICSYPDRVLVVTGGRLSVISGDIAEYAFEGQEPTSVQELGWMSGEGYEEVVDLVLDSLRAQSPRDSAQGQFAGEALREQVSAVESRLEVANGVIVTCSCGHTWVTGT